MSSYHTKEEFAALQAETRRILRGHLLRSCDRTIAAVIRPIRMKVPLRYLWRHLSDTQWSILFTTGIVGPDLKKMEAVSQTGEYNLAERLADGETIKA